MYLTSPNIAYYLIARGLVSRASVVAGDLRVTEIDSRNSSFQIQRRRDPSLFVKQIKDISQHGIDCLQREATCYRLFDTVPELRRLITVTPRFLDFDPVQHVVSVEMIDDSENLTDCYRRLGRIPDDVSKALAEAIQQVHALYGSRADELLDADLFRRAAPWPLALHQREPEHLPPGTRDLVGTINDDDTVASALDDLRENWSPDGLVHGDFKWNNVLVSVDDADKLRIHVIDWELVGFGEQLWDVACILEGFLVEWLLMNPITEDVAAEQFCSQFGRELADLQMSVHHVWQGCLPAINRNGSANERFERCMKFVGVHIVRTLAEYQSAQQRLDANCRTMIRFAKAFLLDPVTSGRNILGLAAPGGGTRD